MKKKKGQEYGAQLPRRGDKQCGKKETHPPITEKGRRQSEEANKNPRKSMSKRRESPWSGRKEAARGLTGR